MIIFHTGTCCKMGGCVVLLATYSFCLLERFFVCQIVDESIIIFVLHRWIGRLGPIRWPARSPDLTPLDFYVWGTLKTKVYSAPIPDREELTNRIRLCCQELSDDRAELRRTLESVRHRARLCVRQRGGNFEQYL